MTTTQTLPAGNPARTRSYSGPKVFGVVFGIELAAFILVMIAAFGYNRFTRTVDLGEGYTSLVSIVGGITSFWALIVALVLTGAVIGGFWFMTGHDYHGESPRRVRHVIYGVVLVTAAAFIGLRWVSLPSSLGIALVVFVGLVAGVTALVIKATRRFTV